MNRTPSELTEQLVTNVSELLQTAKQVKGEAFVAKAGAIFNLLTLTTIVGRLAAVAGEAGPSHMAVANRLVAAVGIEVLAGMPEKDALEATTLAEQMAGRQSDFHDLLAKG